MPMPSCWACHTSTPGTISSMAGIVPEEEVALRHGSRVLIAAAKGFVRLRP